MKPSRNDPCPCGSGKKYKACHLAGDEAAARAEEQLGRAADVEAKVIAAARQAPAWEADVVPLQGTFRETREPGSLVILGAAGFVLTGEVLARRCVGPRARAAAVVNAVVAAGRQTGLLPERLLVRDAALAEALRPELERRGIVPEVMDRLELDEAIDSSLRHLAGDAAGGALSTPWTWAETEASAAELAEFHAAAAAYHRATPWRMLGDADTLVLQYPGDEHPWAASVMGRGGIYHGLALYSDLADAELLTEQDLPGAEFVDMMQGLSLTLSYDPAKNLPKPMRREVASARWELAEADAHPTLMALRVPGRRVTADLLRRITQACRAIAAFTALERPPVPFVHPDTGVALALMYDDDDDEDAESPWPPLLAAHPIGPRGPNADPEAVLRAGGDWDRVQPDEEARLRRFATRLEEQKPSRAAGERDMRAALTWAQMLVAARLPAQSATEFDLRRFLYDFVVSVAPVPKATAKYLTRSLFRLFRYYAEHEGIEYPWAEGVLRELDELADGAADLRDVLDAVSPYLMDDLAERGMRPAPDVPGLRRGWLAVGPPATPLYEELTRRWLIWYDEVVMSGITDPGDVHDILVGRQRVWENTPHAGLGGRSPKQALAQAEEELPDDDDDDDDEFDDDLSDLF